MPKKPLRVALVGCGGIANAMHLPAWRQLADEGRVELAAVCDIIKERADAAVEKFGAGKAYGRYKDMLAAADYDIVDVCTQNRHHCPMTVAAHEAGAHVYCEKPIAMNQKEASQMLAAADKAGRKLMVGQHMRFESAHEELKAVIDTGELGEIYSGRAVWLRQRGIPGWGKFHIKKESLGGPLIDIGVHMMDLAVWLMGSPKPIAASGKVYRMFGDRPDLVNMLGIAYQPEEFDVEDHATALVRFENDVTLFVEVSWAANIQGEEQGVTVLGDKAGVSTNPPGVYGQTKNALTSQQFQWIPYHEPHHQAIRHFTQCVETGQEVRVKPEQSLEIQKIIDAIYESSKKNKEVAIR